MSNKTTINSYSEADDISEADDGFEYEEMPRRANPSAPQSQPYFDPAADYTERTGRYLSLSERMQERSLRDQQRSELF